jgi:quercetin dioxygenase-like cupin family protein
MRIYRNGNLSSKKTPENNFTGDVYISDYFECESPSRLIGATVTFAPGARTPWKVNPLGQTLIVTNGIGWAQVESEEVVEIRAGDIICCPPKQRHWDGATLDHSMTYIALHEAENGSAVEFGEKVTDEEYRKSLSQNIIDKG